MHYDVTRFDQNKHSHRLDHDMMRFGQKENSGQNLKLVQITTDLDIL